MLIHQSKGKETAKTVIVVSFLFEGKTGGYLAEENGRSSKSGRFQKKNHQKILHAMLR